VLKTFQYRIYPTKAQETQLKRSLDACRWVYNKVLETRKLAWETEGKSVSAFDTMKLVTTWKAEHPFVKQAHSQVLQNVCVRVDLAMKAFFRRIKAGEVPGFPRFRGRGRYDSFTYPQSGFKLTGNGKLDVSKIGCIKIVLHRPVEGAIKTLTIKRTSTGKWFASFACEVEANPLPVNPRAVGVDVGLEKFAVFSTGEAIENPRFFRKEQKALAKVQRRLAKHEKGTPERRFHRYAVALTHERIANKRKDFAHKLSHRLVKEFGVLAFEDLSVKSMIKGNLAKSIMDAAWTQFASFTANKAACAGRSFVLVNPRNTSKMCSRCGVLVEKDLSVRVHDCPSCGLILDRDWNAALNILRLGLQSLALGA
jgi:putative transposase